MRIAFGRVVNLTAETLTFVLSPSEWEMRRFARLIAAGAGLSGGFAHAVKVDIRLVSFPLSGVRNDLASNQESARLTPRPLPACVKRNYDEIIPS